jgi:hypothetical protein
MFAVEDIQAGYEKTITDAQKPLVEERITEAEVVLGNRLGDLVAWANTDQRAEALRIVVRRMVLRVLRNPDGFTAETEGNYSYQKDSRVASGTIWVTDEDWALLGLPAKRRRVGSIRIGLPSWSPRNATHRGPL